MEKIRQPVMVDAIEAATRGLNHPDDLERGWDTWDVSTE